MILFSEIYGSYYNAVAAIIAEAEQGRLTETILDEIVREKGFGESMLNIPDALSSQHWPLIYADYTTPIKNKPTMPLTTLQRRWLKALAYDPRIRLFDFDIDDTSAVEALYDSDVFVYFDRCSDGDPYGDANYIKNFRCVLTALREKRKLSIEYKARLGYEHKWVCIPYKLEYSLKDDKFRLITASRYKSLTVNIGRIRSCELGEKYEDAEYREPEAVRLPLVLELTDERNALERAMLHFSDIQKETRRTEQGKYIITLYYDRDDETEMLIRVLSFGPLIKVISPDSFTELIRERLDKQRSCGI